MCSHSCLLCLCGNRKYPGIIQNKLISSFLKWVPKYILFLAKLKREGRPFWNGKAQNYPMNYLLHVDGNVNYYKSVHHPIPTRENREYLGNFQNKSVSSAFNWVSRYILFLAKLKRRRRPFLKSARRTITLWDYPPRALGCHERWKSLSFCEIWNNPTSPLFFIRPPYK